MKSINILFRAVVVLSLVLGAMAVTPTPAALASTSVNDSASRGVSLEPYLNPDGTLNLDNNFSGSLDLKGWDVQLDAAHGPVFSPVAAQGNWDALGSAGAFNNVVSSVVVNGSDVYVGGWFRDLDGIPAADHVARWDGSKWNALSGNNIGDGALGGNAVNVMKFFNGNLYVGGSYLSVSSTSGIQVATNLAKWDGAAWSAVGELTTISGSTGVYGIDVYNDPTPSNNDLLYVGGYFTDLNGIPEADYVASYNITTNTWSNLGDNGVGIGSLTNAVFALAVDPATGEVYAGGFFADADGIAAADRIAKWNGTTSTWSALGASAISSGDVVTILVNTSSEVYVSGSFTNVAGIAAADYIAKWNGVTSTWSALGSFSGDGALGTAGIGSPSALAMVLKSGILYVSGAFKMSDPALAAGSYLAKYNTGAGTWSVVDDNGSSGSPLSMPDSGGVFGLALSSAGELYIGGYQTGINDNGTILSNADYFASMNTATHNWSTYGIVNGVIQGNRVRAIAAIGTDVYVAGYFSNANNDGRMDFLIRWDGSTWNPVGNLTQGNGSINNWVQTLAVHGTDLYVGGWFTSVSNEGVPVAGTGRIAKWDTVAGTWSALGGGIPNNQVYTIAVDSNNNVYAGGNFTDVNSIPEADYIAMWNGSAWSALAGNGSANGALNGAVNAIAVNGTTIYVGGSFTSAKNTSGTDVTNTAYLAQWDGSVWSAIPGTTTAFTGSIFALAYSGRNLYAGGNFSVANGIVGADHIAAWSNLTQTWSGMGNASVNLTVYAITAIGTNVYVGGGFLNVNAIPEADYAAKWNGSSWSALGSNGAGNGALNSYVYALSAIQNDIWVGGNFQNVNNNGTVVKNADYLAVYGIAPIEAYIGGTLKGNYSLLSGESTRQNYTGVDSGPVKVVNTNGVPIIAAERVLYNVNGVNTSYSEMMGLANGQLNTTYWMPWYNNVTLDTQLRLGNVSGATAAVHVFVGGVEMTGSPFTLTTSGVGQSTRVSFAGMNDGPMQVVSDVPIVASERVLYKVNGVNTSFSEMMGLPNNQVSTTYWMPWYNHVTLDTQLRLGNVSGADASVHVFIGGAEMVGSPFSLTATGAGQSTRVSFAGVNNGPLKVVSDVAIVASERVLYKVNGVDTSYSEMIGLPNSQLNTTYWMPWYNNITLDTQLRLGNVSGALATVHVFVGGAEMVGSPFSLTASGAGQSTRVSFAGVNNGPLQVVSDVAIVASERVLYKVNGVDTSYSEMIGLPNSQLSTTYWMPWYNNVTLDTQLRFAVP